MAGWLQVHPGLGGRHPQRNGFYLHPPVGSGLAEGAADTAGDILREEGYDEHTIQRVQSIVRKERIKRDAEAQLLEDVACLVFLENHFVEFAAKHSDDEGKLIDIVRKTWMKMSDQGHAAALTLKLPLAPGAKVRLGGETTTFQPVMSLTLATKVPADGNTLVTRRVNVKDPGTLAAVSEARFRL